MFIFVSVPEANRQGWLLLARWMRSPEISVRQELPGQFAAATQPLEQAMRQPVNYLINAFVPKLISNQCTLYFCHNRARNEQDLDVNIALPRTS
ncbi:hypothetical protein [Rhizobium azibense]|uniref:hypothetical protein n=1 Tax=Rhizobium azibense TaxID=1136135 RepID=UPI00104DC1F0|nr:hypothetical protein [Rhizobium azibense]